MILCLEIRKEQGKTFSNRAKRKNGKAKSFFFYITLVNYFTCTNKDETDITHLSIRRLSKVEEKSIKEIFE